MSHVPAAAAAVVEKGVGPWRSSRREAASKAGWEVAPVLEQGAVRASSHRARARACESPRAGRSRRTRGGRHRPRASLPCTATGRQPPAAVVQRRGQRRRDRAVQCAARQRERAGRSAALCRPPAQRRVESVRRRGGSRGIPTGMERDPSGFLWAKVRKRWRSWRAAGASERVLRWITRGVPCYWKAGASAPWHKGRSEVEGTEENLWLDREEERCVASGAWKEVSEVRYCSRVFLVLKSDLDSQGRRKWRLIIDLRPLNLHCVDFKTRYETLSKLGTLIAEGEGVRFPQFRSCICLQLLEYRSRISAVLWFRLEGQEVCDDCVAFRLESVAVLLYYGDENVGAFIANADAADGARAYGSDDAAGGAAGCDDALGRWPADRDVGNARWGRGDA